MIKCIIFDLGRVYFHTNREGVMKKVAKEYNISQEKLDNTFRSSREHIAADFSRGLLSRKEFEEKAIEYLDVDKNAFEEIKRMWYDSYSPNKGMPELVDKLRKKYSVYIYSGNNEERIEYLDKKYNFMKKFEKALFSFNTGKGKRSMTEDLVEFVKPFKPDECVEIDDKEYVAESLQKVGFHTILFENAEQTENELKKLGVSIPFQ